MEANMCSNVLASRTSVRHTATVTRTRVRWDRVFALVATSFVVLSLGGRALGGSSSETAGERTRPRNVTVQAGQTLWQIARSEVGAEGDPRPLISAIQEASGLTSSELQPGQVLQIPALP